MKDDLLMHVYLEKKFLLVFRLLMFLIVSLFLWTVYEAFDNGYVETKGNKELEGSLIFYLYILKQLVFAGLFIWLGAGGARDRMHNDKIE